MELNLLKHSPHLDVLNWKELMQQLSSFIYFESNKTKMQSSPFISRLDFIEQDYEFMNEMMDQHHILDGDIQLLDSLPSQENYFHLTQRVLKTNWLDAKEINLILSMIESFKKLQKMGLNGFQKHNAFHFNKDLIQRFTREILTPFRKFITTEGEVDYAKHPALKPLFFEVQKKKSALRQQVSILLRDYGKQGILQSDQYDVINGHYVIPVRSDSYQSKIGVIIAHSQSNLTLYVEPKELRKINYDLLEVQSKLEKELYKVLHQATEQLRDFHPFIKKSCKQLHHFDLIMAKARYAYRFNLTRPKISTDGAVNLQHFFHPLIENPVTNSIEIKDSENGLVISGPNTGGKTVALKSIALCSLYVHAGLYVPSSDAQLPFYDGVYFFANDHQNLLEGLSSFAAETSNYLELINCVEENSIIFIDEVFNSTSSEEASALALAVIDKILEVSQSKILISSHHYSFKVLIQMNKNFINAHVGIDHETNSPTYKLYVGAPGSSMALAIFQRIGEQHEFVQQVIKKAETYLSADQIKYEKLLDKLSTQEGILYKEREDLAALKKEVEAQKESSKHILKMEKEALVQEYEKKLDQIIIKAEKVLKKVKKGEILSPKTLLTKESELKQELKQEMPVEKSKVAPIIRKQALDVQEGQKYYCAKSDNIVTVMSVNTSRKQAKVGHKNFTFTCKLSELFLDKNAYIGQKESDATHYHFSDAPSIEVKCLGMRLEEFQEIVEQYLTALQLETIPYAIITHGHGDGVLKKWLRKTLDQRKNFRWSNIDGNDGQTRVELV
jgi:DNA mismatch repair protein MutS2